MGDQPSTDAQEIGDEERPDYDRDLGVIEAITFVTRSCPSGVVVSVAEQALETIKQQGAETIPQQACLLYTSPSPRDYAASRMPSSA